MIISRNAYRLLIKEKLLCLSSLLIYALSYLIISSSRQALLIRSIPENNTPIIRIEGTDFNGTMLLMNWYTKSLAI